MRHTDAIAGARGALCSIILFSRPATRDLAREPNKLPFLLPSRPPVLLRPPRFSQFIRSYRAWFIRRAFSRAAYLYLRFSPCIPKGAVKKAESSQEKFVKKWRTQCLPGNLGFLPSENQHNLI